MAEHIEYLSSGSGAGRADDVRLFYCLTGALNMAVNGHEVMLSIKDMVVLNSGDRYEWEIEEENTLVLVAAIEHFRLEERTGRGYPAVELSSPDHPSRDYGQLRFLLESIVKNSTQNENRFKTESLYYMLWDSVCENFLAAVPEKEEKQDDRIRTAVSYMQANYMMPLNLKSAAAQCHMSESAFSRLFQRRMGINYVSYLRRLRMEHARQQLLTTDHSVTEVAFDCGYASLSAFNKTFRDYYGTTPTELRAKENIRKEQDSSSEEELRSYVKKMPDTTRKDLHSSRSVFIPMPEDGKKTETVGHILTDSINAGMAADLLEGAAQRQLLEIAPPLGIRYVRLSNPFDPAFHIRREHETSVLNFEKLDAVLDFLNDNGLTPVLELPEKLRKIVVNIQNYRIDSDEARDVQVFQTTDEWLIFFRAFLYHIIDRYTADTVTQWKFELWYDVEHRTGIGKTDYEVFYEKTYDLLRKVLPHAQILASGMPAGFGRDILREQLRFYKVSERYPDVLTLFAYPYAVEQNKMDMRPVPIDTDRNFVMEELNHYLTVLREEKYPKTPIWITEWNTSLSERNAYNDSTAKACHMLVQVTSAFGKVDRMTYWSFDDLHARSFDNNSPFMGATGIISKDGILKPSFYALLFCHFLGDQCLASGDGYIVTMRDDGYITLILFNPRKFGSVYRQRKEGDTRVMDLAYIFQDENSLQFSLNFSGLSDGTYQLSSFLMRSDRDNPLTEWAKLGYKGPLRANEVQYLKSICIPRMNESREKVTNGRLQLKVLLGANDFAMLLLSKSGDGEM